MERLYNQIYLAGTRLIKFGRDVAQDVVDFFFIELGELESFFVGTGVEHVNLFDFMFGVALPLFLMYTAISKIIDILP